MTPLRILQICPKVPYPPIDGGCIAANNIAQGLIELGHTVKVLALSTPKHRPDIALENDEYVRNTGFEYSDIDTRVTVVDAVKNLLLNRSYNIYRFYSEEFESKIVSCLTSATYDVVLFESAYTALYLPAVKATSSAVNVYRSHNIEHEIWRGTQALETNPLKKVYLGVLARQLERFERAMFNAFDGIASISSEDTRKIIEMAEAVPVRTIPFGVDTSKVVSERRPESNTVFHLGSMDWVPNQDGIRWFLENVWPPLIEKHPDATLHLAGRSMPDWLKNLTQENVKIIGEVTNAYDFMASKGVMVVPLFSGSGMRIKIIEGLALKKAIISTTLGAAGIDYVNGEQMLIANTASEFIDKISFLLSDERRRDRLGRAAETLAKTVYKNQAVAMNLSGFLSELITAKKKASRQ